MLSLLHSIVLVLFFETLLVSGQFPCPDNFFYFNNVCVQKATSCPPNFSLQNGICIIAPLQPPAPLCQTTTNSSGACNPLSSSHPFVNCQFQVMLPCISVCQWPCNIVCPGANLTTTVPSAPTVTTTTNEPPSGTAPSVPSVATTTTTNLPITISTPPAMTTDLSTVTTTNAPSSGTTPSETSLPEMNSTPLATSTTTDLPPMTISTPPTMTTDLPPTILEPWVTTTTTENSLDMSTPSSSATDLPPSAMTTPSETIGDLSPTTPPPGFYTQCPPGTILVDGNCRLIYCGSGIFYQGKCVEAQCPPGSIWTGIKCSTPERPETHLHFKNSFVTKSSQDPIIRNVNNLTVTVNSTAALPESEDYSEEHTEREVPLKCCTVVTPRVCRTSASEGKWTCHSKKSKRCGEVCIASTVVLKPPPKPQQLEDNENVVVLSPDMEFTYCRHMQTCAQADEYYDCSGCAAGVSERCSSYCYSYRCSSRNCAFYDQQEYCRLHPGEFGCRTAEGCYEDWCDDR